MRTHGCAKTAVDLENGELVKRLGIGGRWKVIVRNDLVGSRRFDAIPVAVVPCNMNMRHS